MKINVDISDVLITEFLKEFNDYEISLDYCWDNSLDYHRYLKEGYSKEEILEEFEIEEEEWDEEYSFIGSYEEFLKFQEEYDCWDYVHLYEISEIKIDTVSKTLYIKYLNISQS